MSNVRVSSCPRSVVAVVFGVACLVTSTVQAQAYLVEEHAADYEALAPDEGTTLGTAGDADLFEVALPFPFRFFSRSYETVWVSVNGGVTFLGRDAFTGQLYALPDVNTLLPSANSPQATLAVVWDDWVASPQARGGGSRIAAAVRDVDDGAGGTRRVFVIDWQNVQRSGASGAKAASYSFQLLLHEQTNQYELRFGPVFGAAADGATAILNATSGSENHLGTVGVSHLGCNPTCDAAALFPSSSLLVSPNLDAELAISVTKVGVENGGPIIDVLVQNLGLSAAEGLTYELFLSQDEVLDEGDLLVYQAPETFELGVRPSEVSFTVPVTLPADARGPHYIIGRVDGVEPISEQNKANNVSATLLPFVAGAELSIELFGQSAADAGGQSSYNVLVHNAGVKTATDVVFRLELWGGTLVTPVELYVSEPLTVDPEGLALRSLSVTMPADLPPGPFMIDAVVDVDDLIEEGNEDNNRLVERLGVELRGADVEVSRVRAGLPVGHLGQRVPVQFVLSNRGTAAASDFLYAIYLSKDNDVITRQDVRVFLSEEVSLAPGEERLITQAVVVPETLETGLYYPGVIADAAGRVRELNVTNNVAPAPEAIVVAATAADLVASSVASQPKAQAGAAMRVTGVLGNVGTQAATFEYSLHLSDNELVSASDARIASGVLTLSPGQQYTLAVDAIVPPTLRAGHYRVALIADAAGLVTDVDRTNNQAVSPTSVEVVAPVLRILNDALPDALIDTSYEVLLGADGAAAPATWRVVGGELPPGLSLDASGRLSGVPTQAGVHAVVVEASSAELKALASFTLAVRRFAASLGVLDEVLPAARRGVQYAQRIGVTGGTGEASFELVEGSLPPGLVLREDGRVEGYPTQIGASTFVVDVRDEAGQRVTATIELQVLSEAALSLAATRLREAEVARAYSAVLPIEGGEAPYTVSLTEGRLPDGVTLLLDASGVAATLSGTPTHTGLYPFQIVVADARGERSLAHLVLQVSPRRLSFITTALPDAPLSSPYHAVIEANAQPPFAFSLAGGALPAGLSLDESGLITGAVVAHAAPRLYAFAARVVDAEGGEAIAAFSIDVPAPAPPVDEGGCASGGATMAVFGLIPLLFGLRRRRALAALAATVVCASALPAQAYYRVSREPSVYVPLPDEGSVVKLSTEGAFDQTSTTTRGETMNIPFSFKFYGIEQSVVGINSKGMLSFGATSLTWSRDELTPLPGVGGPSNFVAPMWGYVQLSKFTPSTPALPQSPSKVLARVEGEAPRRVLAVEWQNLQHASPQYKGEDWAAYSVQVRLHEGTNEITMHYGGDFVLLGRTPPLAFAMGLEGIDGQQGVDASDTRCSPGCTAANFPIDTVIRFEVVPELSIDFVEAPQSLFEGIEASVRAVVRNDGDNDASRTRVRYLLSRDQFAGDDDIHLADSPATTIVGNASATLTTRVTVPAGTAPGLYYLLSRVDPDDEIVELDESNNDFTPQPVVVIERAADFVPVRLMGPNAVDAGEPFTITRTVRNQGNAAGDGSFRVVLSANQLASVADLVLEEGTFSLAPGEALDLSPSLTVPASVTPGEYYLALLVRPAEGTPEIDPLNNDRLFGPVLVRGGGLAITREALPDVAAGVPFSLQFTAAGGAGRYVWRMGHPGAPEGTTLSETGVLSGRVETTGEWPVQVQVESNGNTVSRLYRLRATGVVSPLQVVTRRTVVGQLAAPYVAHLLAQGGAPPYTWALAGTSGLPAGLAIAADGTIEGVPVVDGEAVVSVQVTDAEGTRATGELVLPVAGPTRPLFAGLALPAARLGQPYEAKVQGAGGAAPYRFTVVDTRRTGETGAEDGQYFVGELPPGLALSADGDVSGTPTLAGLYVVTLRLVDARSNDATAQFAFAVQADGSLSVRSRALPTATIGVPYTATLTASGASGSLRWEAVFADTSTTLPPGLALMPEGYVVGTPLATGRVSFLAVARDAAGQVAMQPLALEVVEAPVVEEEGCSQAGSSGLLALLVVFGLFLRRRATGAVALAVALLAGGCSSTKAPACEDACAPGLVCDANDGLCKCGGEGGAVCADGETCDADSRSCLAPTCETGCPFPLVCGDDGECRCGGPNGAVCAADETCSAFGRCEPADRCSGVVCAAGMTCDEATGACGCGASGEVCGEGERCADATCVADLCLGVACSGGNACDPNDGLCKCGGEGGAVCSGGEACEPVSARCVRSSRCEDVTCGLGSSCDPADGLCKCGGAGGPVCGDVQSCDPVERRCLGGDQCQGVTCERGTSCDPEDGLCKCGGYGGAACGSEDTCVVEGAQARCEQSCALGANVCGDGRGCGWDPAAGAAYCQPTGTVREGQTCSDTDRCAAGLHCVESGPGTSGKVCRAYCLVTSGCGEGALCFPFQAGHEAGACLPFTTP